MQEENKIEEYDENEEYIAVEGFEASDPSAEVEDIWQMDIEELERIKDSLTEEEYLELLYLNYPSVWIEENFRNPQNPEKQAELRWYQTEMINEKSKKKIVRAGRQLGKCLDSSANVLMANGNYVNILNLYNLYGEMGIFKILSFNEDKFTYELSDAMITDNGLKDTIYIKTKSGNEAKRTYNHPYLVWRNEWDSPKWVNAGDLIVGDRIATIGSLENVSFNKDSNNTDLDINECELIGLLIGDGGLTEKTMRFTSETDELPMRISNLLCALEYNNDIVKFSGKYAYGIPKINKKERNDLTNLLRNTNLYGKNSHTKRVPIQIINGSKENICAFLSGLWATDGYITIGKDNKNISVGIGLCNKELINDVRLLLLKIGIISKVRYKAVKYKDGIKDSYSLEIFDRDNIIKFATNIEIPLAYKDEALLFISTLLNEKITNSKNNTYPKGIWNHIFNIKDDKKINNMELLGLSCSNSNNRIRRQYSPNYRIIDGIADVVNDDILFKYTKKDIYWDTVKELKPNLKQQTYNIMVPGNHTLIADNFIEHNSQSIIFQILYYGLKRKNSKILVIGPQKTHVEEIFEACELALSFAPHLKGRVTSKRQPMQFVFHLDNGTTNRALFLTTGEDSGGKGLSIRGKTSNVLFVDEADYINDDCMEKVVIPTTNSFKKPFIWLSSTPTGRRGFFRNTADAGYYKPFHYPSNLSPAWSTDKEAEIRNSCTKLAYTHEYDAEWGDAEGGLFSKEDLHECSVMSKVAFASEKSVDGLMKQYSFKDDYSVLNGIIKPVKRILGVDWNKAKNGTRLVWVDFDEKHNAWLRGKWNIDDAEFTQNKAMQKIIELHKDLNFDFIMVDVGYGGVQIEDLHLYGLKYKSTRLNEIVIGVETGGQIEINDIATGESRRTYIKNFIVESAVRFCEQHRMRFPKEENIAETKVSRDSYTIIDEMADYCIDKYTSNGRPVYKGKSGDHSLDAYMFTIYGYITQVIKTQKLWDKMPLAKPKTISYEKILSLRSGVSHDKMDSRPGEKELKPMTNKTTSVYENTGYTHRSIKRTTPGRFSSSGKSKMFSRKLR